MPIRNCPSCYGVIYATEGQVITCKKCGKISVCRDDKLHNDEALISEAISENDRKERKKIEEAKNSGDWSDVSHSDIDSAAVDIILTTSYLVAGREIESEIEILTAECVFGMNIFKDFLAGVRDIFGGRSAATQKVLRDARRVVLTELRRETLMVGGDAVIAIDLDYQELSGGGKLGMLMIVASGTAVRLASK